MVVVHVVVLVVVVVVEEEQILGVLNTYGHEDQHTNNSTCTDNDRH